VRLPAQSNPLAALSQIYEQSGGPSPRVMGSSSEGFQAVSLALKLVKLWGSELRSVGVWMWVRDLEWKWP